MPPTLPNLILLAGPNGAGKSTAAPRLLHTLAISEFVNADTIAAGLSALRPESVAFEAGRIMLERIHDLALRRASFAFETTLATRSFAPLCRRLAADGYLVHIVYLWLPSPDAAIARVRRRVQSGGHNVPEHVIRRRYTGGLHNFFNLYMPLATIWKFYDNARTEPNLIATSDRIVDAHRWQQIKDRYAHNG